MAYVSARKKSIEHCVDLSDLYLKEGAIVLVANSISKPFILYESKLPDEEYFAIYGGTDSDTPHDVIHVTLRNGLCRIYFNPDDQEQECAEIDFKKGKRQQIINKG